MSPDPTLEQVFKVPADVQIYEVQEAVVVLFPYEADAIIKGGVEMVFNWANFQEIPSDHFSDEAMILNENQNYIDYSL
jgi:hypothetical protein